MNRSIFARCFGLTNEFPADPELLGVLKPLHSLVGVFLSPAVAPSRLRAGSAGRSVSLTPTYTHEATPDRPIACRSEHVHYIVSGTIAIIKNRVQSNELEVDLLGRGSCVGDWGVVRILQQSPAHVSKLTAVLCRSTKSREQLRA